VTRSREAATFNTNRFWLTRRGPPPHLLVLLALLGAVPQDWPLASILVPPPLALTQSLLHRIS